MAAARGSKKDAPLPRLTFEQIEQADDLERGVVDVPEWNGSVAVRGLRSSEWDAAQELGDEAAMTHHILSCGMEDPEITAEQAAELKKKSAAAVLAVENAILRCSKMDPGSLEAAKRRFFPGAPVKQGP
jgi:hypothetical protein